VSRRKVEVDLALVEHALRIPDVLSTLFAVRDGDDRMAASESAVAITQVAAQRPDVVWPYRDAVVRGMRSPYDRVRRESIDTLTHLFHVDPIAISANLPRLSYLLKHDPDLVVRNHAIDAVVTYGSLTTSAGRRVLPILMRAVESWNGKNAPRAMKGLLRILPALHDDFPSIHALAERHLNDRRATVQRMAGGLFILTEDDPSAWDEW
jgi:hypothetical protein